MKKVLFGLFIGTKLLFACDTSIEKHEIIFESLRKDSQKLIREIKELDKNHYNTDLKKEMLKMDIYMKNLEALNLIGHLNSGHLLSNLDRKKYEKEQQLLNKETMNLDNL